MTALTVRERICLMFLNDKMEATARMIGQAIVDAGMPGGHYATSGANVAGALRKRGLVTRLPELRAWRITREGREALDASEAARKAAP